MGFFGTYITHFILGPVWNLGRGGGSGRRGAAGAGLPARAAHRLQDGSRHAWRAARQAGRRAGTRARAAGPGRRRCGPAGCRHSGRAVPGGAQKRTTRHGAAQQDVPVTRLSRLYPARPSRARVPRMRHLVRRGSCPGRRSGNRDPPTCLGRSGPCGWLPGPP